MRSPRIRIQRYLRCVLHFIYNQILVLDSELVELLKMYNLNRHSFSSLHTIRANSFSANNQPDYIRYGKEPPYIFRLPGNLGQLYIFKIRKTREAQLFFLK